MDGGTVAERDGVDVDELLRGTVGIMWGGRQTIIPPPADIIITGHCNSVGGLVISSAVAQGASSDLICYHTVEILNEL